MAITKAHWLVAPLFDGSPGILTGVGAPGSEVYDKGTIYNRNDAVGVYQSDGAGTWTQILDSVSAIADHAATATAAGGTGATGATAPTFTGDAPTTAVVDYVPQGGTGYSTAGQVVTTTDNHTLTLNELAYSWLITATHAPCLIISNTAVSGAPAVLTVFGEAPPTTAEAYKILRAPNPSGSVSSHTHTGPSHTHNTPVLAHTITP